MCYLVTGVNISLGSSGRYFCIFDTEKEAKADAEELIRKGHGEVILWKQLAAPKIEQKIIW